MTTEKKPRGRPRKTKADEPEARPRGRSRKAATDGGEKPVVERSAVTKKRLPNAPSKVDEAISPSVPTMAETLPEIKDEFDYSHLNPKTRVFIESYVTTLNGQRAALIAGYAPSCASRMAVYLLEDKEIKRITDGLIARYLDRIKLTKDRVLSEIENMFLADANELVEYRRVCCRHCWGEDFKYQETPAELRQRKAEYEREKEKAEALEKEPPAWDDTRVLGFNRTKPPNPECPECWGQGVGDAYFKDTRELTRMGKSIYAGVELTKNGIKINMHDKGKAAEMLAKHHKLYEDKVELNVTNFDSETLERKFQAKMEEAHRRMEAVVKERGFSPDDED